jgi:hypothetical protein
VKKLPKNKKILILSTLADEETLKNKKILILSTLADEKTPGIKASDEEKTFWAKRNIGRREHLLAPGVFFRSISPRERGWNP